jgi:hypothetical protein
LPTEEVNETEILSTKIISDPVDILKKCLRSLILRPLIQRFKWLSDSFSEGLWGSALMSLDTLPAVG